MLENKELQQQEKEWLEEMATPEFVEYEQCDPADLGFAIPKEDLDPDKKPLEELLDADDMDYNAYVAAKVKLPKDGHTFATGKVIGRARDINGELIGKSNPNPLLDTSVFEVRMEDGSQQQKHEHDYGGLIR